MSNIDLELGGDPRTYGPGIPTTDEEAHAKLAECIQEQGRPALLGLYAVKRLRGASVLDAYEATLQELEAMYKANERRT